MAEMTAAPDRERIERAVNEAKRLALWGCGIVEVYPPRHDGTESDGKMPIGNEWQKRATRSPHTIEERVGRNGQYGVIPWPGEGVLVLDVDHKERLPTTLPSGYRVTRGVERGHAYFRLPDGFDAARLPATAPWGEVRVQGASRHVVGPYSRHTTGDIYIPHGDELTELPLAVLEQLFPVLVAPKQSAGEYVIPAGGYQLPDFGYTGSRYDAIRDFIASRYMKGLPIEEIWVGMLHTLAPRFAEQLPVDDLRARFDRAWKGTPEKFGPPGALTAPRTREEITAGSIDAADLLELDIPPMEWVVPDLIPEGTTILAGPPKLGKSCLVYQVAVGVALGGDLLGRDISQGSVLYLALEDGKRRGQTRLRAALGDRSMPRGRLEVRWSAAKLGAGLEQEIIDWLDTHPDARLVAIDTLQRVRARTDSRRNAYEVDVEDLGRLQDLFRDRSCGLLVVHHSKKDAGDDFLASVSGTYGITGSVDTTLVIQRKRLEAFGKLVVTGRDVAEIEEAVQFNGLTWTSAPRSLAEASFEQAEVYKVIETHGPIFAKAISDYTGSTREAAQRLIEKLVSNGSVVRSQGGYVVATATTIEFDEEAEEAQVDETGSQTSSASFARARAHTRVPTSSASSASSEISGEEAEEVPTHVRVRETRATPPVATWCRYFVDHQSRHRDTQTAAPWCEVCTPRESAA